MFPSVNSYILPFKSDLSGLDLPVQLNNPFENIPGQLAQIAANELITYINNQTQWHDELFHNQGKMFGVLVVADEHQHMGYLAAFSGKLEDSTHHPYFVPPVFDTLDPNGFYKKGEEELKALNRQLDEMLQDPAYLALLDAHTSHLASQQNEIKALKAQHQDAKKRRDQKRIEATSLDVTEKSTLLLKLDHESARHHYEMKDLTKNWKNKINAIQLDIQNFEKKIDDLKSERKKRSAKLQQQLFESYHFLNQQRESKNLLEIFNNSNNELPPSGAGECVAPKLFQFAFTHQLLPLSIAEFWYGKEPVSEIRKHLHFYGSCKGKCEPILGHMLNATAVESKNTFEDAHGQEIEILYHDDDLAVVYKPHGLLSVPGKKIQDSVLNRAKLLFPEANGPIIVHRLDMSTSGLMIIAKNFPSYQNLQAQFTKRKIEKKYIALLDAELTIDKGSIDLPLRVDLDNRPHQLVCDTYGKPALTHFTVLEIKNGRTKVEFTPITGRTHQLRVHAAHQLGLNAPILGDDLYGERSDRLYLQAQSIAFYHPVNLQKMKFELPHEF